MPIPASYAHRQRLLAVSLGIGAAIIVATTWPPASFVGHAHWDQVEWIPFTGGFRPLDILANLALFVPLGWSLAWGRHRSRARQAAVAGLLLSLAIELFQVYCHGHFPTMTDVAANTAGAWLGARVAQFPWRSA